MPVAHEAPATFLAKLQAMPALKTEGLWPAQISAIQNLEQSLKENRPRALIQMAAGSGKTFTAISFIYRLIKFAGARRVLFLVDRGNLGDQILKEFQQYISPYNNFKFSEEYIVQRLQSNTLDTTARVCICTLQRMYSMLKGKDLPADLEEVPVDQLTLPSPASGITSDWLAFLASLVEWLVVSSEGTEERAAVRPEPVERKRATSRFNAEQLKWLEMIRDHIAANLGIEPDDFEYAPFAQEGGLGKVYQLFGDELNALIEQLNESLAA